MTENYTLYLLDKINKLSIRDRAYAELLDATATKAYSQEVCACCKKKVIAGANMIEATKLESTSGDISFRKAKQCNIEDKYTYKKEKHKICLSCADMLRRDVKMVNDNHLKYFKTQYKNLPFDEIDIDEYAEEIQLDIIMQAYNNGELTINEYKTLKEAILHNIEIRDSKLIGSLSE